MKDKQGEIGSCD